MELREQTSARVGLTAMVCAALLRFWSMGAAGEIAALLLPPQAAAFHACIETGRLVRFSPSDGAFSPDFAESPPAVTLTPEIPDPPAEPEVLNTSGVSVDIPALLRQPLSWQLRGERPTVLILHTHTTESYTNQGDYVPTSAWRTLDTGFNMLSIGARVAQKLTEAGIPTVQDRSFHDYPSYNGSYVDARESIQAFLDQYPTVKLVLDLHRDASDGAGGQLRTLAAVQGRDCAQLMVVLGTNHKHFRENLALALKLHALLEAAAPGIMRPLQLRPQRFNQDLSPGGLLIEVGAAGNTHDEALLAADQLAEAIIALADGVQ